MLSLFSLWPEPASSVESSVQFRCCSAPARVDRRGLSCDTTRYLHHRWNLGLTAAAFRSTEAAQPPRPDTATSSRANTCRKIEISHGTIERTVADGAAGDLAEAGGCGGEAGGGADRDGSPHLLRKINMGKLSRIYEYFPKLAVWPPRCAECVSTVKILRGCRFG